MKLSSAIPLALLWLTVMATSTRTLAQAAGPRGCCTGFSKVHAVIALFRAGSVRCHQQSITEGCNINAIVVTGKGRKICVDPTPRKMRKYLTTLCKRGQHLKREEGKHRAQRKRIHI